MTIKKRREKIFRHFSKKIDLVTKHYANVHNARMVCKYMNFTGLIVAAITFFAIGLGFVWVIKLEYHVGAQIAKWVAGAGIFLVGISVFLPSFWISAITGILGGTTIWGATELPDQALRAKKGQFPINPKNREFHD